MIREDSVFKRGKEELKREKEMMRGKSFRQKAGYFFTYYKIPFIIIAAVIVIIISICYSRAQYKGYAFQALFFNVAVTESADEELSGEFSDLIEFDESKYKVMVDSTMVISGTSQGSVSSTEKFSAEISEGVVDVCIMPEELFRSYANEGAFGDLRDFLTEEQLSEYEDLLVYDGSIPIGIYAASFTKVTENNLYVESDRPIFGIVYNTQHMDECSEFLDYLTGE